MSRLPPHTLCSPALLDEPEVLPEELLIDVHEARRYLSVLDVPDELQPRDGAGVVDLVCVLDRLFATGCGHDGIARFLAGPVAHGGPAPRELLRRVDGVDLVRALVERETALIAS